MMKRTKPSVVVVTGASGGVGRATARAFARQGACVALLARGHKGLEAAAAEVRTRGGQALVVPVDVADHRQVTDAANRVEEVFGPVDVWVNNAFTGVFAPFVEIEPDEFRRVTEVTYLGYVYGTHAALSRMLPRDHGTVVQVGSALAYRGLPLQSAYSGAKHAIQGWHEALRCELLHQGSKVRTTMVQLPALNTPQFGWVLNRMPRRPRPVPPVYEPEIAARAIVHAAAHPRRREYWVGASTVATLVANAVAPGLMDRYLARTAYGAQQRSDPAPVMSPVNLWHPVDGDGGHDYGAHGDFGRGARVHGPQLWLSEHRGALAGGAAFAAAALAAARMRTDHGHHDR